MAKVAPIKLTNPETGKTYTLEYNRRTAAMAERDGLTLKMLTEAEQIMNLYPLLFHYAFLMHHPTMKKADTEAILYDELHGLTTEQITRLVELYAEPYNALVKEEDGKNSKWSVEI